MWEKEKLLLMSNFSFSHSVFKRHVPQTHKNQGSFGKVLHNYLFVASEFFNSTFSKKNPRNCGIALCKNLDIFVKPPPCREQEIVVTTTIRCMCVHPCMRASICPNSSEPELLQLLWMDLKII